MKIISCLHDWCKRIFLSKTVLLLWGTSRIRYWCKHIFSSKTTLFIWGLMLSQSFADFGVVNVLMDDLTVILNGNMRKSVVLITLQDSLSSIFSIVIHLLVCKAGRFSAIIFSTACYVTGLMIFWLSAWTSKHVSTFCGAMILLALGKAGQSLSRIFLKYQLKEKLNCTEDEEQRGDEKKKWKEINPEQQIGDRNPEEQQIGDRKMQEINPEERKNEEDKKESRKIHTDEQTREEKRESGDNEMQGVKPDPYEISSLILKGSAYGSGILVSVLLSEKTHYPEYYKIGALLMGAAYLLFYSGSFCYRFEEARPSPLYKICGVFKEALGKLGLKYPTSCDQYYRNNGDGEGFYTRSGRPDICRRKGKPVEKTIRLKPHVPSIWRFLDKAAIKRENPNLSLENQVENGQNINIKAVSEVKHISSLVHLSFILFPYSLVTAAEDTFFVEQASDLKSDFDKCFLFFYRDSMGVLVRSTVSFVRRRKCQFQENNITIVSMGVGIFCAVLCSLTAWQVESRRLSLTKKEGNTISMSIAVLIPQFLLIGLMKGFLEHGLTAYYSDHLTKCMESLEEPLRDLMLGIGRLLTIPCIFIFHGWFKDSINDSHLDRYFLVLVILNILSLCFYVYYSLRYFRKDIPKDQGSTGDDEPEQSLETLVVGV